MKLRVFLVLLLLTSWAVAGQLTVTSYTMYNGYHGSRNYHDFTYVPCRDVCDVNGALLYGGTGKLTDGFYPPIHWNSYGEWTDWVGWGYDAQYGVNPTVTFYFAGTVLINSITIWADNTPGDGPVYLPADVVINGTTYPVTPSPYWSIYSLSFSGLNLSGNSVNVQFLNAGYWVMIGEVTFNGTTTPEPATLTFLCGGVALAWWRRRKL